MRKLTFEKKAAMEMSVGTIVTIVLLMTVLILGLVLVKQIFFSGTEIVDLTTAQLRAEVEKLFSEESKLVIYPTNREVKIRQGNVDGVGLGIKNLLRGTEGNKVFSYVVTVSDPEIQRKCGVSATEAERWIKTGRAESNIIVPVGDFTSGKVLFEIPVGAPLCTIRFRVNVEAEGAPYASDFFDMIIEAK